MSRWLCLLAFCGLLVLGASGCYVAGVCDCDCDCGCGPSYSGHYDPMSDVSHPVLPVRADMPAQKMSTVSE